MTDTDEQIVMAKLAYGGYGNTVGWKAVDGSPMKAWTDLPQLVQAAWVNAANAVYSYLEGPEPVDD